jgi:hypothetical protein
MSILSKQFLNRIFVCAVIVCALFQGWILRHQLINCLPFKEMGLASYQAVATVAIVIGPLVSAVTAIALTKIASLIRLSIAHTLTAGFICPVAFLLIYRLMTPVPGLNPDAPDFSTQAAWTSFACRALLVMTTGLVCTGSLLTLVMFFRPKVTSPSARALGYGNPENQS